VLQHTTTQCIADCCVAVCCSVWQCVAVCCRFVVLHVVVICMQHKSAHGNTRQRTATHCNIPPNTATHSNRMQFTATNCSALQHATPRYTKYFDITVWDAVSVRKMKHTATRCNTQRTAQYCNTHMLTSVFGMPHSYAK